MKRKLGGYSMSIARHLLYRTLGLFLVVLGVLVITFVIARVIPGDPASLFAGPQHSDPETLERIRTLMGLKKPLYQQLVDFITAFFKGDLGFSWHTGRSVAEELANRFPVTFELSMLSLIFSITVGIPLGIISAVRHESTIDYVIRALSIVSIGIPSFWLGLLLIYFFGFDLKLLPIGGLLTPTLARPPRVTGLLLLDSLLAGKIDVFNDALIHYLMPAFSLGIGIVSHLIRLTRASVLEVLQEPYVVTAVAKGLPPRKLLVEHVLRNALMPVTSWTAMVVGYLLGGSILIENIFGIPGVGSYVFESIVHLDYAPILASVLLMAIIYFVINFVLDILYVILDPRVRLK